MEKLIVFKNDTKKLVYLSDQFIYFNQIFPHSKIYNAWNEDSFLKVENILNTL